MSPDRSRLGVTFPLWPFDLRRSCELAPEAEDLGYTDGWSAETAGPDGLATATAIGAVTSSMRTGCAVVPVFTRPPALIAMGALAAHQASGGRFCLGLGASSQTIVERWMGTPFERPTARVRETLAAVKAALAGDKVELDGETLKVRGFRLEAPAEVPILLAALGPQMMALAGAEADGIALFLATEAGIRIAREKVGPDKEVFARLLCCPFEAKEDVRAAARWMLAPYIAVPAYNRFISIQGFEDEANAVTAAWGSGDRVAALEAVSDRLLDALVLMGTPEECRARIATLREAGLDTPVLWFFSPQGGEATERAFRALAPARGE